MRFRTCFLSFLLILVLCTVSVFSSALANVTSITPLGDGSAEVRWDDNDATDLIFVNKTGDNYDADMAAYGYFSIPTEGKSRMTVYVLAPGQSYWIQTMNSGVGFTNPYPYDVGRASNFNEWNTAPKIAAFELKMRDSVGGVSGMDYFLASDLENLSSFNSYGIKCKVTWPQLSKARTYLWQFVIATPDGYKYVLQQGIIELPKGGYYWHDDYMAVEDYFHLLAAMRGGEVPVGQYTFSLYWSGQHISSVDFWVR